MRAERVALRWTEDVVCEVACNDDFQDARAANHTARARDQPYSARVRPTIHRAALANHTLPRAQDCTAFILETLTRQRKPDTASQAGL